MNPITTEGKKKKKRSQNVTRKYFKSPGKCGDLELRSRAGGGGRSVDRKLLKRKTNYCQTDLKEVLRKSRKGDQVLPGEISLFALLQQNVIE